MSKRTHIHFELMALLKCANLYSKYYGSDNNNKIRCALQNGIFVVCAVIFYTGNIGYLIHEFQHGTHLVNVSFTVSTLLSYTYALITTNCLKNNYNEALVIFSMIENNPYLSLKNAKVLRGFHANNKLQKFLYVYAAIFIIFQLRQSIPSVAPSTAAGIQAPTP